MISFQSTCWFVIRIPILLCLVLWYNKQTIVIFVLNYCNGCFFYFDVRAMITCLVWFRTSCHSLNLPPHCSIELSVQKLPVSGTCTSSFVVIPPLLLSHLCYHPTSLPQLSAFMSKAMHYVVLSYKTCFGRGCFWPAAWKRRCFWGLTSLNKDFTGQSVLLDGGVQAWTKETDFSRTDWSADREKLSGSWMQLIYMHSTANAKSSSCSLSAPAWSF